MICLKKNDFGRPIYSTNAYRNEVFQSPRIYDKNIVYFHEYRVNTKILCLENNHSKFALRNSCLNTET